MRRADRGFSLIEVMIATAILGIGLTGVIQAVAASIRSGQDAEHYTTAVWLAAEQMEMTLDDRLLTSGVQNGSFEAPFHAYEWRVEVKETREDGLFEVVVSVSRTDSGGALYELTTMAFVVPDAEPLEDETEETRPGAGSAPRRPGGPR